MKLIAMGLLMLGPAHSLFQPGDSFGHLIAPSVGLVSDSAATFESKSGVAASEAAAIIPVDEPCLALGAFNDLPTAQQVAQTLASAGMKVRLQITDVPAGRSDYRVLLPPAPSSQEAFRRRQELKSRNIDSYIIATGDDSRGISLGVLSSREAAVRLRRKFVLSGYDARIKEMPRFTRSYWIHGEDPGEHFPGDIAANLPAGQSLPEHIQEVESACIPASR